MFKGINWIVLAIVSAAFYWVMYPAWYSLVEKHWINLEGAYSHGYVVLVIFMYMLSKEFSSIDLTHVKPAYWIIPIQFGAALLFILSVHANILIIQWAMMPVLIMLFFLLVLGINESRQLWFPVIFLYFGIPVWSIFIEIFQWMTVFINTQLLAFINIPVFIDGFYVTIPEGNFEIAGGCSGLKYFIVNLMLSSLYGHYNYSTLRAKFALIVVSILMALFTNWVRVFVIIYIGHVTNMESSLIEDHSNFGWILFAGALIPFFYVAYKIPLWLNDSFPEVNLRKKSNQSGVRVMPFLIGLICTSLLPLIVQPTNTKLLSSIHSTPVFVGHPNTMPPWFKPVFPGSDVGMDQVLKIDNMSVQVSIRGYATQQQGDKELISFNNSIYPDWWKVIHSEKKSGFQFNIIEDTRSGFVYLSAYLYSIGGVHTTKPSIAKLLELIKPLKSRQDSTLLILTSKCVVLSCDAVEKQILSFIELNNEVILGL